MKICHFYAVAAAALTLSAASCVNDDYDLSDIDTTSRFEVKDLTLPVNLDAITLKTMIDIDDESDIQIYNDGTQDVYAYINDGTFNTSGISIPKVTVSSASIAPIVISPTLPANLGALHGTTLPSFTLDIPTQSSSYKFEASNVTEDICDLTKITADFSVKIDVNISGLESIAESTELKDFVLMLPKGITFSSLENCTYDSSTGKMTVNGTTSTGLFTVSAKASALSIPAGAFDEAKHSLLIQGEVGLESGKLTVNPKSGWTVPSSCSIKLSFTIGNMTVNAIDGTIKHSIDDVNIPDIDISSLPDIFSQSGTDIAIANPQLLLTVNNPLSESGVYAQTGLDISAYHDGKFTHNYTLDNAYMTIGASPVNHLGLAPSDVFSSEYTFVPFKQLSYVLSGEGVPDMLKVCLTKPNLPEQTVTNFLIGHDFGKITGSYKFVAPLQFLPSTVIKYSDTDSGWNEDLEDISITHLKVAFKVTSDLPISIKLTGHPIDTAGKRITDVTISEAIIPANAVNHEVVIEVDGKISKLDGLEYEAVANADNSGQTLSPDMEITLSDVRATVTGYYEKEL